MIDFATLSVFAIACLALAATPGPDMLLIASRSVSQGRAAGFASLAGIQLGTYCHALAAAFGLSQLFVVVPAAYDVVRFAGAAYLLFLAWQAFRSSGGRDVSHRADAHQSNVVAFRQGLVTNLLNPKMALFVLALLLQFVRPEAGGTAVQIMILATVLNLIGLGVNGIVIMTASRISTAISGAGRFRRLPQMLLGTVFAGLAVRLAFDGRR